MKEVKEIQQRTLDEIIRLIIRQEPKLKEIYHIYLLIKDDIAINAHTENPLKKSDGLDEITERAETSVTAGAILHNTVLPRANSLFQSIWCEGIGLYIPVFNHAGNHFAFFSITPRNGVKIKDFYANFNLLLPAIETVLNRNNLSIERRAS